MPDQKTSPFLIASAIFHPIIERISIETRINPRSSMPLRLVKEVLALLSIDNADGSSDESAPWIEIIQSSLQCAYVGKISKGSGSFSTVIHSSEIIATVLEPIPPNNQTFPFWSLTAA